MWEKMQDYRKLNVWKKAHLLAVAVYKVTNNFPREENYTLTSQVRRASVSIPANIAEGCGRGGGIELGRFLQIASGSTHELEYHLLLAKELGYLKAEEHDKINSQVAEIKRMLSALIKKIKTEYPKKANQ
jgi:four helix bundle protein